MDRPPPIPDQGFGRRRLKEGDFDHLVNEEPLGIDLGATRFVTMRSPGQDRDLVLGFLLAEGIIDHRDSILEMSFRKGRPSTEAREEQASMDWVRVQLQNPLQDTRLERLSRVQEIRPSCGICGVQNLEKILPQGSPLRPGHPKLARKLLLQTLKSFHRRQGLFQTTGGCHGAAICASDDGRVLGLGEDIGRHNALDKAIGQAMDRGYSFRNTFILLSGRAGYELICKALRIGCPILVSISAASALSFDLCREAGMTLVGFARHQRLKIYWDEERLQ
jgi:FdhD protein